MMHNMNSEGPDKEIYYEKDETYSVYSYKTKNDKFIVIGSSATLSQEYRYLDANNQNGELKVFQERINGLEYSIDNYNGKWFIRTNKDSATNFKLMTCEEDKTNASSWRTLLNTEIPLEDVDLFKDHLVITERKNGLRRIEIKIGIIQIAIT